MYLSHSGNKWFRLAFLAPIPGIYPNHFPPPHSVQETWFPDPPYPPAPASSTPLL